MKFVGALTAVACLVVGFNWATQSWRGVDVLVSSASFKEGRIPAAVSEYNDLSHLTGESLYLASKERVLKGFQKAVNESGDIGIELGNFIVRAKDGSRALASDTYEYVKLTFVADGVATSGEIPRLQLISRCRTNPGNANKMATFWLTKSALQSANEGSHDLAEITKTPLTEGIVFYDLNGTKPQKWILSHVELIHTTDADASITMTSSRTPASDTTIDLTW